MKKSPRQLRAAPKVKSSRVNLADSLTALTIWLLLAGGVVREVLGQTEIVSFGSYSLHSIDPCLFTAMLAMLGHVLHRQRGWPLYTVPILVMSGLIAFNFIRGLATDFATALLWFRANGGIVLLLLLAGFMRPSARIMRTARNALLVCAVALGVLVLLRLATYPSLFMALDVSDAEVNDGGRALSAQGTFLMVLASGLVTTEILQRGRFRWNPLTLLAIALPVLILLTRQGTAIIAEFFVLAIVIFLQPGKSQSGRILLGGATLVALFGILAVSWSWLAGSEDVLRRSGTLEGRREVWAALMDFWTRQSLSTQLFGLPGGQKPALHVFLSGGYREWLLSFHSMYYGALPMMGYIGALAYVALLAMLTWGTLVGIRRRSNPGPAYPFAFCVATAILSYSYEVRGEALMGLFMVICWHRGFFAKDQIRRPHPLLHRKNAQDSRSQRGDRDANFANNLE